MLEEIPIPSPVSQINISHQNEFDIHSYDKSKINQDLWPVDETNVQNNDLKFLREKRNLIQN